MAQLSDDCFAFGGELMRADEALSLMRKYGALRLEDVIGGGQLQSERLGQSGH